MDILVINKLPPHKEGGAERVIWEIAKEFSNDGHEVTFLTPKPKDAQSTDGHNGINFEFFSKSKNNISSPVEFLTYGQLKYRKKYQKINPDIVYDNASPFSFPVAHLYGEAMKITKVHAIYSRLSFQCNTKLSQMLSVYFNEYLYHIYNDGYFITNSESTSERLANKIPEYKDKIYTIPIGIEIDKYELNISYESNMVLAVSGLTTRKNIKTLLNAWPIVQKSRPNAKLVIAGDGPQRGMIEDHISNLSNASYEGYVNESKKIELYENARIFALPTLYEGFGMAPLEAMASGCAVCIGDAWGVKDYIHDGVNGFLTPPNDNVELANKICILLENDSLYNKFAVHGRKTAEDYDMTKSVAKEINLVKDLLADNNSSIQLEDR